MTLQPAAVIPADVELLITDHFDAFLEARSEPYAQGVRVGGAKPPTGAGRIVSVRRDGGAITGVFDQPRVTVRVWSDDADDAGDLARLLVGALKVMPLTAPGVVGVLQVSGPMPIPDQSQPQVMVTCELLVRCIPL